MSITIGRLQKKKGKKITLENLQKVCTYKKNIQ